MEDTDHEVEFRKIIYEKFARNKRNITPVYNETIETLKITCDDKKNNHSYYILEKYEVLQCGDVENLSRNAYLQMILYYTI